MLCPLCNAADASFFFSTPDHFRGDCNYFKCPACDLVFLDPVRRLSQTEEKARYDLHQNSLEDAGYVEFLNRLIVPVSRALKPGARGLDFGSGPAPVLAALMQRAGFAVEFYDPFYAPELDWENRKWDFITCTEVLEHLFEPGQVFEKLSRVMSGPGSLIAVMTQLMSPEIDFSSWWYRKDPTHVCFFSRKSLDWAADRFGFEVSCPDKNIIFLTRK